MKKLLVSGFLLMALFLSGCQNSPKKVATNFMKSLVATDYDKSAALCGYSKDKNSKDIVITMVLEQFGTGIHGFTVTRDSIFPDNEHAVVFVDISYNSNIKQLDCPVFMRKMNDKWVVDPFTIEE